MTNELNKLPTPSEEDKARALQEIQNIDDPFEHLSQEAVTTIRNVLTEPSINSQLLAALEAIYRCAGTPVHADERHAQELARTAIAKARGQQ